MYELFPPHIAAAISKLNPKSIREIRFRAGRKIIVNYNGVRYYLSALGVSLKLDEAISCDVQDVKYVISKATENSLYAYNEQIKNGFLTLSSGWRIGFCGEAVEENGKVVTFKNFSSLTVRIASQNYNCALKFYEKHLNNRLPLSVLVVSPPGGGKTTFLRDLSRLESARSDVTIIDSRYEFAGVFDGKFAFDIGECDVISGIDKSCGIQNALRTTSCDVIVCDEISVSEAGAIDDALKSGVSLFASAHAFDLEDLKKKKGYEFAFGGTFGLFVVLCGKTRAGVIKEIYDGELKRID